MGSTTKTRDIVTAGARQISPVQKSSRSRADHRRRKPRLEAVLAVIFHPPKDYCPMCPTKNSKVLTEIPQNSYDIVVFENKFPTFSRNAEKLNINKYFPYKINNSLGICEVVCYTQEHNKFLEDQPIEKIEN